MGLFMVFVFKGFVIIYRVFYLIRFGRFAFRHASLQAKSGNTIRMALFWIFSMSSDCTLADRCEKPDWSIPRYRSDTTSVESG